MHTLLRDLPVRSLAEATGGKPFLVLAPHPDDESLGCGGLIAQATAAGQRVFVLVLTDGTGSHPHSASYPASRLRRLREAETVEAVSALGVDAAAVGFLGLKDTRAPSRGVAAQRAVAAIAAQAQRIGAAMVFTSWRHDPHADHLAASILAGAAGRQLGVEVFEYPVWGWTLPPRRLLQTNTPAGFRLDIAAEMAAKKRAIACHRSQLGQVIADDPAGFTMQARFVALFSGRYETFVVARGAGATFVATRGAGVSITP